MSTFGSLVERSLDPSAGLEFADRVDAQTIALADLITDGELDNPGFAIGLELEVYAVDDANRLAPLPPEVFTACAKELGVHNAELNTPATAFDAGGIDAQLDALIAAVEDARAAFAAADRRLVMDGMWTVGPPGGARAYLEAMTERDGVPVATHMRENPRYAALDRDVVARAGGEVTVAVPGATLTLPSIIAESLTTSIQPHLQVPTAAELPTYYNVALRTMAPILALSTNSPFLPYDLYDADADPAAVVDATHHELRIAVFEQSINTGDAKVRFPGDIDDAADIVHRVRDDATRAPFCREWVDDTDPIDFRDHFWELDHKRGTYWRWLRGIAGGQPVDPGSEQNLRIEYRPLPTQPTLEENVALQLYVTGAIRGLVDRGHPITKLPWEAAHDSFYRVARDGRGAEIAWVRADGARTADQSVIYDELTEAALDGLTTAGLSRDLAAAHIRPVTDRIAGGMTPSEWKLDRVREGLDAGATLPEAIERMQYAYIVNADSGKPVTRW
jgi:hypothetical protein